MVNFIYKTLNLVAAISFIGAICYAVIEQAATFTATAEDHTIAVAGLLGFIAFVVLAWFVIDSKAPRAI